MNPNNTCFSFPELLNRCWYKHLKNIPSTTSLFGKSVLNDVICYFFFYLKNRHFETFVTVNFTIKTLNSRKSTIRSWSRMQTDYRQMAPHDSLQCTYVLILKPCLWGLGFIVLIYIINFGSVSVNKNIQIGTNVYASKNISRKPTL